MTFVPDITCIISEPVAGMRESFGYIRAQGSGTQLYFVRHHAHGDPRGAVLLCGAIGAERERIHRTLVDVARRVSVAGFDAFRFDYRGVGESTGYFGDYCLSDWRGDILLCLDQVRRLLPARPVGLWGVRAGALLASELFSGGVGDGAVFCAPADGSKLLADTLRRSLVAEMQSNSGRRRATREGLVAAMDSGALVDVDGYPWSGALWRDAASHVFIMPTDNQRAWRLIDFPGPSNPSSMLEGSAHRVVNKAGRFWESSPWLLTRDTTLAATTIAWLQEMVSPGSG